MVAGLEVSHSWTASNRMPLSPNPSPALLVARHAPTQRVCTATAPCTVHPPTCRQSHHTAVSMITLLLAAAACAASGVKTKCDGSWRLDDVPYVINETATPPVLGFTPAGDGVVAVCAREPGSSTVGYIHLLNASTGGLRQVTKAECVFPPCWFTSRTLTMNGQYRGVGGG